MTTVASLLLMTAATAAPLQVEGTPKAIVLGSETIAEIVVRAPGHDEVKAGTNLGVIQKAPVATPSGEWRFLYRPPEIKHPETALLFFWVDVPGARPIVEVERIALVGRTDVEITTEPFADVTVELQRAAFGPVKADEKGRAVVPLEVMPGETQAKVVAQTKRHRTTRALQLDVPRLNPLAILLGPDPMPKEGGWLMALHTSQLAAGKLDLHVQGAQLEEKERAADRVYFRVAPLDLAEEVRVVAGIKGDTAARAEARVAVHRPARAPEPSPAPTAAATVTDTRGRWSPTVSLGGFYGGARTVGPQGAVGVGYRIPGIEERLTVELSVGWRAQRTLTRGLLTTQRSEVTAIPIDLSVRANVLQAGAWNVYGRAGGGPMPFRHRTTSTTEPDFEGAGVSFEAFAAAWVSHRLGRFEPFLELKGALSPFKTARLDADGSGLGVSLGLAVAL